MTWDEIALRYPRTDKSSLGHDYMPFYQAKLEGRDIRRVLEIGIGTGDSLRMWADIWPEAAIMGIDTLEVDGEFPPNVHVFRGDARYEVQALRFGSPFDLIVDDASHELEDVAEILGVFADHLAPGGLYVVEDTVNHDDGWPASTQIVSALLTRHGFNDVELFPSALDAVTMTGMTNTTATSTYLVAGQR